MSKREQHNLAAYNAGPQDAPVDGPRTRKPPAPVYDPKATGVARRWWHARDLPPLPPLDDERVAWAKEVHKQTFQPAAKRQVVVRGKDEVWAADTLFMYAREPEIAAQNDGYRFILVVIDCFTRYAWAVPMREQSNPSEAWAAMERIFRRTLLDGERRVPDKPYRGEAAICWTLTGTTASRASCRVVNPPRSAASGAFHTISSHASHGVGARSRRLKWPSYTCSVNLPSLYTSCGFCVPTNEIVGSARTRM